MNKFRQTLIQYIKQPLVMVFSLLICCNLFGFVSGIPTIAIAIVSLCIAFIYLLKNGNFDFAMLMFLLYLPLELLLANPDSRFHSWERMVVFVIMMISVSPLIQSKFARSFRYQIFQFLLTLIVIASIISFFCYFFGINFMIRNNTNVYEKAGLFGGLFSHSMILGPMASLASLLFTYKAFIMNKKWLFVLSSICACAVLFSASRGSFVALIIATMFLIYKYADNKQQLLKIYITSIVALALTYPVWNKAMSGLEQKQAGNISKGSMFSSRESKWTNRIDEFASSPLWGVGFSSINPNANEYWNKKEGKIEPGSSWLSICSMLGLLGLILIMNVFVRAYKHLFYSNEKYKILLLSYLAYFCIHMLIEGYVFAAGSPICVFFWLLIGCCYDNKYLSEEEINDRTNFGIL